MLKLRETTRATPVRPRAGNRVSVGRSFLVATLFAGSLLAAAAAEARGAPESFADLA